MSRASEWVVTTKLGASDLRPGTAASVPRIRTCRFYAGELAMSMFVLTAAAYGAVVAQRFTFSIFLFLQGEGDPVLLADACCRAWWTLHKHE